MECPFEKSLWMDCLFEVYDKCKREGKKTVEFSEVDALVVEKSRVIKDYVKPKGD